MLTKHPSGAYDEVGILAALVNLLGVRNQMRTKGQSQLVVACRISTAGHVKCMVGKCRQCTAADADNICHKGPECGGTCPVQQQSCQHLLALDIKCVCLVNTMG